MSLKRIYGSHLRHFPLNAGDENDHLTAQHSVPLFWQDSKLRAKQGSRHSRDGRPTSRTSMSSTGSSRRRGGSSRYMGSIERKSEQKGMILGFQPLNVVFKDICYSVDLPSVGPVQRICDRLVLITLQESWECSISSYLRTEVATI